MKIDWKKVSRSEGYRSLKAAYVRDVQESARSVRRGQYVMRDKREFRIHFKEAIGLALHYSHKWQIPIETVLNYWESNRDFWWLNFYQHGHLRRLKPSP